MTETKIETAETKAANTMAQMADVLLTYVSGPVGWPYSKLTANYSNYYEWLAEITKKNAPMKAVILAGADRPDTIKAALVEYFKSLEPKPEPKPPVVSWEQESPGMGPKIPVIIDNTTIYNLLLKVAAALKVTP